jgi:microcystin-dependent protein
MPNTVNKAIITPNTGDLSGTWGSAAVNPNMTAIDGMLGGAQTISLSVATSFSLSLPSGSLTPGAGPNQSQNALLKFTGTLTGNANITFGMPGFYIVHNACTVGAFYIKLVPSGGGNSICAPPGRKAHVFYDGTDMDYVDMLEVGAALDLHQSATTMPAWITNCTVKPYLIKDGTVYNVSTYPQLGAVLGSTFGGNGASTFGVPNELSRVRIPVDTSGAAGRITAAGSGVNGTTMGAAGGSQFLQTHSHTATVTDPTHFHQTISPNNSGVATAPDNTQANLSANHANDGASGGKSSSSATGITVAVNGTGSGSSGNVMPVIVSFLPLVKT